MLTDFKFQYLSVMRERSPAMFKELTKSGELDEFVEMQVKEAVRLFEEITQGSERDESGRLTTRAIREADEIVKGMMFEFPMYGQPDHLD
jgi:hypothetical protein